MAAPDEESISPEPEVFEDPPSPHPSSDSEEFQSIPNSPEEPSDSETRYQVLGVPPRKEAKKVCGDITRLLRDKKSSTRGSRMFRKRRKRSERFSIVGYGTQPVDTDTDCSTGRDKTDSAYSLGSTDDEIAAYDRPGPHNVLERENRLSTTEQLLHNQHRHLAMDAAQMKGKGAKLFARRQRRMDKYVLEKKNEEKSETSDADSIKQNGRCQQEGFASNLPNPNSLPQMSDERGFTPISFSNIHSSVPDHRGMDRPRRDEVSEEGVDVKSSRRRSGSRTRPSSRMPWTNGSSGRFASADWSTDDESADRGRPITAQQKGPQIAYRKVQAPTAPKPPIAPTLNIDLQKATRDSGVKTNNAGKGPDSAGLSFIPDTPTKSWRSVRFVPRKGRPQTPAQSPQVAYPCIYEKEKIPTPQPTHQPVLQPTRVRAWSKAPCARTTAKLPPTATQPQCSPSVALLQQPLQARSPSPFRSFEHISATPNIQPTVESNQEEILQAIRSLNISTATQQTNQIEITSPLKTDMVHSSIIQEVIPPGISHTGAQLGRDDLPPRIHFEEENDVENELALLPPSPKVATQQLVLPRPHSAIQPSNTNVAPSLQPGTYQSSPIRGITPQPSTAEPESGKPKIAACLKLLDPTKGKYEPKMELVYKQTPTLGAILDGTMQQSLERPQSRNSYVPQQFNKPIVDNQGIPPSKYSRPTKPPKTHESPVSLGSIAGAGLRGKGARIFEKQQQRMQRYTQEASGCKQQEPPPEAQPSHYRKSLSCSTQPKPAPAVRTKENMGHVLGEFRKFSDSESPKRPSANRKGRSRDPCHYQHYYVARRPPSAIDFVCTDDAMSDTNSATSSLSSSYDLGSTCSSRRLNGVMQRNDDVFQREAQQQRGPPPKVAPKPKLERFLSADPTLVADRPGETKDDGDNIDVNHQFGINNGESHNTGEENGGSLNSAPVNGDREISKPAFSVWSPGSGSSEMPTFPKLPPPPNYHDVTPAPSVIPRPTFNAIKHVQQAVNGVIPVTESPPQVTVAKPRFTTTKTPETWKPKL